MVAWECPINPREASGLDPEAVHRACAVVPFDDPSEPDPPGDDERPAARFATGVTRAALRNLPTYLVVTLVVYYGVNGLRAVATGRFDPPSVALREIALLAGGAAVAAVWLFLIYRLLASGLREAAFHRTLAFFGTGIPLAAGTAHALYVAWTNAGTGGDPAFTVQTGFFLFVLVAGHLVYDGFALRTERLLSRLADTSIVSQPAYDEFYGELRSSLGDAIEVGDRSVPKSVAFALVVALVPLLLPIAVTPGNGWGRIAYASYALVTLLVVAVLYDVFVLVYEFTELLRRDVLEYQPFHPDDRGGFRDLGRFATRVNTVLAVAGGYVAYRLYAEGLLNLPAGGLDLSLLGVTWLVLYAGPVVAYAVLVAFWLYHSFWRLHRTMEEGRQRRIEELQRRAKADDEAPSGEFADLERDAPVWESLRDAPTWPIKRQGLFGILVVDAVPVAMTFLL